MPDPLYLVDTSVFNRAHHQMVGQRIERLMLTGKLWTCRVVDIEFVFGSRAHDVAEVIEERRAINEAPITPAVMDRALEVIGLLAHAGMHRSGKPADLIIAAAAEAMGLTVLHYDADFTRISEVTGQPVEWVAPPGTLP